MKMIRLIAAAALLLGMTTAASPARAGENDKDATGKAAVSAEVQHHLDLAANYEKLAAEQQALIDEHAAMKVQVKKEHPTSPKQTMSPKQVREMNEHCDALIAAAKKEKAKLEEFAKWHKMRAAEAEGK